MKYTFTCLIAAFSILIITACSQTTNDKKGPNKPKDGKCKKISMGQFKICRNKQVVMSKDFNAYFGIADTAGGSPISFSTNLSETLPDSSLRKLYSYTTDNDSVLPGLRIYYGLDNQNNIVYIYQPVNLEFDSVNAAEDTAYYSIVEVGGKWRKDTATKVCGLDLLSEALASKSEKNYMANTLVYRNILGDFSHIDGSADALSITFPWVEFDTLARENLMKNSNLSINGIEEIINLHSFPDLSQRSLVEIENNIIKMPNAYMKLYGIVFTTGAEMYRNDTSFQHTISLAPLVVNSPAKFPGTLTNMDANMGSLCPPSCASTVYSISNK